MAESLERRVHAALSRLESALGEGPEGTPSIAVPCASGASAGRGGSSVFSFGAGSPFEPGAAGKRLSLDSAAGGSPARMLLRSPGAGPQPTRPPDPGSILSCRPWSREDMSARLATFSARRWFAKPARVSPVACARHGWTNPEYDMLACAACAGRLRAPRALDGWSDVATGAFETALDEGHAELCPWRGNACPVDLLAIVLPVASGGEATAPAAAGATSHVLVLGRAKALSALRARFLALAGPSPEPPAWQLPAMDPAFFEADLPLAAQHAGLVSAIAAPSRSDGLSFLAAIAEIAQIPDAALFHAAAAAAVRAGAPYAPSARLAVAQSALCCALLGWCWGTLPAAAAAAFPSEALLAAADPEKADARMRQGTLHCAESARTLGVWSFSPAGGDGLGGGLGGGLGSGDSGSLPVSAVGSKRARLIAEPRGMHPAREHAVDSPWVERLAAGGPGGGPVPAWAIAACLLLPESRNVRLSLGGSTTQGTLAFWERALVMLS
ncbi:C3HC zinc finger-like-domain-containing protein [Pavlovales sp. CCMP2436]|nr:C3HC zinc finger-like-domain-containing protein [Pavlovales sp. CCMP2436]